MSTLKEKALAIISDKEKNLLSANLKQGVTCLGVDGNLIVETGDATATSSDILIGKTAYANNTKVVGSYIPDTSGYDLSDMGSTLMVQASSFIEKGDRWEGELVETQTNTHFEKVDKNMLYKTTNDMLYSYTENVTYSSSDSSYIYKISFLNESSITYTMKSFNITSLLSDMGITSGSIYLKSKCNEDGHLLVIEVYNDSLSNNKLIVCEMNIKARTFTPYVFTLPFKLYNRYLVVSDDDIFIGYKYSSTYEVHYYHYNKYSHILENYHMTNEITSSQFTEFFSAMINNTPTCLLRGSKYIIPFVPDNQTHLVGVSLENDTLSFSSTSSIAGFAGVSKDLNYVIITSPSSYGSRNGTIKLHSFDELTFTIGNNPIVIENITIGNRVFMNGNLLLSDQTVYLFNGVGLDWLWGMGSSGRCYISSLYWEPGLWGKYDSSGNNSHYLSSIIVSQNEVVISPINDTQTQSSKLYGIASKSLAIGERGNAQLLFST